MKDTRRTRLTLGALLVCAFVLITVDAHGDNSPLSGLRDAGATVFGPVERVTASVARPIGRFFGGSSNNSKTVQQLRDQVTALQSELRTSSYARNRANELNGLLRVAGLARLKVVPAQVIAIGSAQGFSSTVTIDAGSRDGIKPAMTVLDGDGLIGRTLTVSASTSTVLLLGDPNSSVGVRVAGSMQIGIAQGDGPHTLTVQLLDSQAAIKPGNVLLSFGSAHDVPYVPGIPVGRVVSVKSTPGALTRTAVVRPYADYGTLDLVGVVVQPPRTDPRDVLAPPSPSASPSSKPSTSPSSSPSSPPSRSPTPSTSTTPLADAPPGRR